MRYTVSDGEKEATGSYNIEIEDMADAPRLFISASDAAIDGEVLTIADFSSATSGVYFDMTLHETQSVGEDIDTAIWNTTQVTGSEGDDIFAFSQLRAGDHYTVEGGAGNNTIDLSSFRGDQVTVDSGNNSITVDIGGDGNTATISYTNINGFDFQSSVFDGTPHSVVTDDLDWVINGTEITSDSTGGQDGSYSVALIGFEGTLDESYTFDAEIFSHSTGFSNHNGGIVFDYQNSQNYKAVMMGVGADDWSITEVVNGISSHKAIINEVLETRDCNSNCVNACR